MKTYVKPQAHIMDFAADTAFASVACTSSFDYSVTTIEGQTIYCVIEGHDTVFDANASAPACDQYATDSGQLINHNGTWYYAWEGTPTSIPSDEQIANLLEILSYFGITDGRGWHAGPVSPESISIIDYYTESY